MTIAKVAWLHVVGRRLLCARSHGRDIFYVPGGKPEAGETSIAALKREISEELNVALIEATIVPYGTFRGPADGKPETDVVIETFTAICDGTPEASSEIAELRWIGSADDHPISAVARQILVHLKDHDVID